MTFDSSLYREVREMGIPQFDHVESPVLESTA